MDGDEDRVVARAKRLIAESLRNPCVCKQRRTSITSSYPN